MAGFSLDKKDYIYKWRETKTVNINGNSFTLVNVVPTGGIIRIFDRKYGVEWFNPQHWSRTNQVVTLSELALSETLDFDIYCYV